MKASCLPKYTSAPYPFRPLQPYVRRVFDAFGPTRMFCRSDLSRLPCTYRECVTLFTEELPWLKGENLEWVMGRGLCEWIGWTRDDCAVRSHPAHVPRIREIAASNPSKLRLICISDSRRNVMTLHVLHPVARKREQEGASAPRLSNFQGKQIALYWNHKPGGDAALRRAGELLKQRYPEVQTKFYVGSIGGAVSSMNKDDVKKISEECAAAIGSTAD